VTRLGLPAEAVLLAVETAADADSSLSGELDGSPAVVTGAAPDKAEAEVERLVVLFGDGAKAVDSTTLELLNALVVPAWGYPVLTESTVTFERVLAVLVVVGAELLVLLFTVG
jgi:hypothetical protein